ncbi:extracellular GDSL-like lipase/acylhydrolase [Xylariales sp. PMI_506]|nr:extracellular GDSL-like lipase/acylhydrolase [Xylariales sp. PMI_506]
MPPSDTESGTHWVAVWAAMPQLTEESNMPPPAFNQPNLTFDNTTIRQTLRVTTGAEIIRIRLSNAFGLTDLHVSTVTIALPDPAKDQLPSGSRAILEGTLQVLTFGGQSPVDIPLGAPIVSDAIRFPVQAGQVITVTMYLPYGQVGGHITSHPGSRTTSWLCHGDYSNAVDLDYTDAESLLHWYFIAGVEAWQSSSHHALVFIGDSITDGRCSTDNGNDRWPDLLLGRMMAHPFARNISVLNQAAGGNRVLTDGLGPNVLSRLDRDVFGLPGVMYVMVFSGVNDIGKADADVVSQAAIGDRLIKGYEQIALRVHSAGLAVFGATITPFSTEDVSIQPYSHPMREATRQRVNNWIRTSRAFDHVIDFDAVIRDPSDASKLRVDFDSGDHLHPTVKAFDALANSFPLELFEKYANGVHTFI